MNFQLWPMIDKLKLRCAYFFFSIDIGNERHIGAV